MAQLEKSGTWRGHVGWLAGQLIVVFAGVSAAFVVENYRDNKNQQAEFRQALSGVIAELNRYETRGMEFADGIDAKIAAWQQADRSGTRAIPGYYRIPGATHPPSAAWTTMVSSGLVRLIEPGLRTELGLFYSEVVGIHDNYDRYNHRARGVTQDCSRARCILRDGWSYSASLSCAHGPAERICR
jgi:hypothetical protein